MVNDSEWIRFKEEARARLLRDREIGYLDPDIWDLLEAFMGREKTFTYSSCSGRITVIDSFYPWSRKDSSVIYKNHLMLPSDELLRIIERKHMRRLWLIVQGPILHAYTKDYEEACTILKTAREVGFKHSGILVENRKGVLVELRTGIRMVHLLKDRVSPTLEEMEEIVKVANEILAKGKEKKDQLREAILSIGNNSVKLGENPEGESQLHNSV